MRDLIYVLLALCLVALNAFFVMAEFALVKVRNTRIEELVSRGVRRAIATREALNNLNAYLSACQLGITLASLGLGWVGEPAFAHLIEPLFSNLGAARGVATHTIAVILSFLLITVLHIVLGEVVPKNLAIERAEASALLLSWPLRIFYRAFYPAIWAMNHLANLVVRSLGLRPVSEATRAHSEEELRMIVASSRKGGVLSEVHARLLSRALDFTEHTVRQIMVPRGDIVFLDINKSFEDNLRIAREGGHTRYPLCDGDLDRVLGVVHIKTLFVRAGETPASLDLQGLAREPLFAPESLPIEQLLTLFQKKRLHMGIVIDEYGGASGIVTLEDVLEELTGEIQDEFDQEEPKVQSLSNGRISVDATLPLDEIQERLGIQEETQEEVDTLGGLILARLGRMAHVGDAVVLDGRSVEVSRMRGRRILRLLIHPTRSREG